jgi:surface polysaccharide O-acyltransferase-like enzyme
MKRELWPDIYRGIAIIAVVLIHSSSHALSQMSPCGWSWYGMALMNRLLQFAVPAFLLVSAYLNASSLDGTSRGNSEGDALSQEDGYRQAIGFFVRRGRSLLVPYLLASGVGLALVTHFGAAPISILHLCKMLVLGKCYYHLYFVALIFQLYAVLPVLVWTMRRHPAAPHTVLIGAVGLQLVAYAVNRWFLMSQEVGMSLFWYVLPVALGLCLHRSTDALNALMTRSFRALFCLTLAITAAYAPVAVIAMIQPVNTFVWQVCDWAFAATASLLLVAAAVRLTESAVGQRLASMGRSSLVIYLAHPFVIVLLDHIVPSLRHAYPWIAVPVYGATALAISACLAVPSGWRLAPLIEKPTWMHTLFDRNGRASKPTPLPLPKREGVPGARGLR